MVEGLRRKISQGWGIVEGLRRELPSPVLMEVVIGGVKTEAIVFPKGDERFPGGDDPGADHILPEMVIEDPTLPRPFEIDGVPGGQLRWIQAKVRVGEERTNALIPVTPRTLTEVECVAAQMANDFASRVKEGSHKGCLQFAVNKPTGLEVQTFILTRRKKTGPDGQPETKPVWVRKI